MKVAMKATTIAMLTAMPMPPPTKITKTKRI